MAEYLEARDLARDAERVAELFTPDNVWEAVGPIAHLLGRHEAREAIARRGGVSSHERTPFSTHFLTNESIRVDGATTEGRWTFLQAAESGGRALWIAGRYRNDFVRVGGAWKMRHLRVENVVATPYEDGWAKTRFFSS